jgi:hypothetical protein
MAQTAGVDEEPLTLLLPTWLLDRFDLARAIAEERRWSWSEGYRLLERFQLRGHERTFVKTLLKGRTNLRLFRSNQRQACGDFVVVDMSAPQPSDRRVHVMELKTGDPLAIGGARLQCARYRDAVQEIAVGTGIIDPAVPVELLYGDAAAILVHLGVAPPRGGP